MSYFLSLPTAHLHLIGKNPAAELESGSHMFTVARQICALCSWYLKHMVSLDSTRILAFRALITEFP